ncbi:YIP1 family protein [Haloferax sp. MBLA0076]|uniref:YIP1 family protein n=1 Tax=Haloferax litoreum TaxID=2666140 RepID=A0A6A8GE33_9EURY|nr:MULTISPECIES: Yip1 family protein [Haloferax]KAB1192284.1 YIP1 family protein [Haloferax sp. CBA1148]MRX20742.1 YIP1 family protein [Haloferax litoreum]
MAGPRTPLLEPREYFDSKTPPFDFGRVLAVVALLSIVLTAGVGGIFWTFTQQLDQQVSVDNPDHVPAWSCEQYEDGGAFDDMSPPDGCDSSVPETIDRRLGDLVWQELSWVPWAMLLFVPLGWVFQGAVLHIGSSLVGGSGRFTDTLVVAGWGLIPSTLRLLVVGSFLVYHLSRVTLPANPNGAVSAIQASLSGLGLLTGAVTLVVVAWATYVRTYGLARGRDVDVGDAALVTVGLSVAGLFFELL